MPTPCLIAPRASTATALLMTAGLLAVATAHAAPDPWTGTAYLRQEVRHSFEGQPRGLARQTFEGLLAQCNLTRKASGAPENRPSEDLMAGLDIETVERFFDNGRAATRRQGYGLELTDMRRWMDERAAHPGSAPATPPDCSVARKVEIRSTLLWKDGVRYELRADRKGSGLRRHPSLTARPMAVPLVEGSKDLVHGEPCVRVAAGGPVAKGDSCLWTRYPLQEYLNFPWALSAHRVVGMGPQPMVEDVRTLELTVGRPSPAGVFDVPADYAIKVMP